MHDRARELEVFVINLPKAGERRESIGRRLGELGVRYSFFEAIDGSALSAREIDDVCDMRAIRHRLGRDMSKGEIGCAMSHRSIYRRMIGDSIERAVVLEDDIIIDEAFPKVLAALAERRPRREVVKLDNSLEREGLCSLWSNEAFVGPYRIRKPATRQMMAWGYFIDLEAARAIMDRWPKISFCADNWDRLEAAATIRAIRPAVVHEGRGQPSDIEADRSSEIGKTRITWAATKRAAYLAGTFLKILLP
jgi:glycosyl transferase family 25